MAQRMVYDESHMMIVMSSDLHLQWNLSNMDILGPIKCVLIREVSSF